MVLITLRQRVVQSATRRATYSALGLSPNLPEILPGRPISRPHLRYQSTVNSEPAVTTSTLSSSTTAPPPPTSASAPSPTPSSSRILRVLSFSSIVLLCFVAGFSMAANEVAETVAGFVDPPTDEETLTMFVPPTPTAAEINQHIITHPLAVRLRADPAYRESRPHMKIPPAMRAHNLTAGTLLGADMIEVPPLSFNARDAPLPTMVQFSYLGPALCGHPGLVHGGLLATVMDEGLARCCFPALPNKVGVTASLKIDYRVPCPAGSYVVFKAETTKVEGRKAWVKGWIEVLGEEDGTGVKVVEAEALFVEPRQAAGLARIYSGA